MRSEEEDQPMAWSKNGRIRRPQAWTMTGAYRKLVRRLPRWAGSRRRLLALAERRARGMGGLGATREEAAALALARAARPGRPADRRRRGTPVAEPRSREEA
jgi:hypothetical protein